MSSPAPFDDARTRLLAANLGYPIAWQNEPWSNPEPPAIWLAVEMTSSFYEPVELGANAWEEDGCLYIHVNTPSQSGTDSARAAAKAVADVFRGVATGLVVYRGGSIGAGLAADPEGAWWVLTVTVNWCYRDITS